MQKTLKVNVNMELLKKAIKILSEEQKYKYTINDAKAIVELALERGIIRD